jgi:hypothetical protein
MTLPIQGDPVDSVLRGQEFFRLKQELQSAGDIFEIDESTKAIYIGPQSDVSEIRVAYFDPSAPSGMQTTIVSPNGPLIGRVDSLNAQVVASTGLAGRMLVTAADFIDPNYERPVGNVNLKPSRTYLIRPIIDLICALKPLPDIPDIRADKTYRFPSVPIDGDAADESTDIIIPLYGRRLTTVWFVVPIGLALEVVFMGAVLQPGSSAAPQTGQPRLLASDTIPSVSVVQTRPYVFRASSDIEHLVDSVNGTDQTLAPVPGPIGMMDYFIINLMQGGVAADLAFVDVYIKLSDREG